MTGSFSSTPFSFASWNRGRQHAAPTGPSLSICQSSLWGEFHSETARRFIWALLSSHYRCKCLPERKRWNAGRTDAASNRGIVPRRMCLFSAVTWHRTALGDPPESTARPTTKECEASSVRERREKSVRTTVEIFPLKWIQHPLSRATADWLTGSVKPVPELDLLYLMYYYEKTWWH